MKFSEYFQKNTLKEAKKYQWLYILLIIPILQQLVFSYLPMYGIIIAFKNFKMGLGIFGSHWVGLDNFREIINDHFFTRAMLNTIKFSVSGLAIGMPLTIMFALLLNEIKILKFKKVVQTISYLPHFLSWVIISTIVFQVLSPEFGILNKVLLELGILKESIFFMAKKQYFLAVYLISGLWAGIGWGTILYLAAISGIDQEQYESANIDGANRWHKMRYITLPGMKPTITIVLILNIGGLMSVSFDQIFNLMNDMTAEVADVLSTLAYQKGLIQADYSYGAALGLFQNVIGFVLLFTSNLIMKKYNEFTII